MVSVATEEQLAASVRGTLREHILEAMVEFPKTPSDLQRLLNKKLSNLSVELHRLEEEGLVIVLNTDRGKTRHYKTTPLGMKVLGLVRAYNEDMQRRIKKKYDEFQKEVEEKERELLSRKRK
jgi:DNA-binding PadR family transcriptional regulator